LFSGKTTLTETLEKKLEATRFYSPPPNVSHLREIFDALPEIILRAYYCVGNFIVGLAVLLVIMSVSTFKTTVILRVLTTAKEKNKNKKIQYN
jgi:hypothetical protein